MRPGLPPGRIRARRRVREVMAAGSGRRGARCRRGRRGGRHRCRRGRRRGARVPSTRHRRGRLRDGHLIVRDGERARRRRGSGRRSLRHRRRRCARRACGRGRPLRLRVGARRAVGIACERGHPDKPESERKDAGADERQTPGTRPAAGLVPGDRAATLPVGDRAGNLPLDNRRSPIARRERFRDGCGCGGSGHAPSLPQPLPR
jgi:hypothetical protein